MSTVEEAPAKKLPFHLRGNYAPVIDEISAVDLEVHGALPPELDGRYLRNGPNPKSGKSGHWFMGDGMIHGMRLSNGRAEWYRNRYVQTRALNEPNARMISETGEVDFTIGVNNTHVISHAGKILTLVESSFPCELDHELETVGVYDYAGKLDGAMTAHPKVCPVTGELHFFGYSWAEPYLTYHRVNAGGELVESKAIDVPGPTMIHDFSITETQVIFMDLPVVFDFERALAGTMPYAWDDDYGARLGVMPRSVGDTNEPGQPTWFDIDPCYVFHPMNSFDTDSGVVLDTARYPELWRADANFQNDAALHRFEIDVEKGSVTETALDDRDIEFPRVAEHLVGLENRYGYATATFGERNALVKYDLATGDAAEHDFGTNRIPGEAVFVPSAEAMSGDGAEDDGWLLAFAYDKAADASDFVVLDASDMAAAPVATVRLPQRVPFGFHGSWVPAEQQ